ncbi:hypothetical protein INT47_009530, partial [Mucor saturninus]
MMVTKLSSVDADMSFFEDEDECEDEADLLVESNSDLNDDKPITLDNTQKDLTAKEARAELEEAPKNNDGLNDIVNLKEAVRNLNVGIKESKAKQARLSRLLLPLEKLRMDQARNFRIEERGKDKWDEKKYNDLKEARANCDKIYSELKSVRATISNNQTEMYRLNKILHKQPLPADNINKEVISDKDITSLAKGDIVVQGIDPGVVTTASFKGVSGSLLFESINRYTALKNLDPVESATNEKQVSLDFTAKMVNNATFSTKHRQERHRRENQKIQTDVSYLEKKGSLGKYVQKNSIRILALVSEDGLTLPPFRRGVHNPNKFNLSENLMQARIAMQRSPGEL